MLIELEWESSNSGLQSHAAPAAARQFQYGDTLSQPLSVATSVVTLEVPSTFYMELQITKCLGDFGKCKSHDQKSIRPFTSAELALAKWICQAVSTRSLERKSLREQILGTDRDRFKSSRTLLAATHMLTSTVEERLIFYRYILQMQMHNQKIHRDGLCMVYQQTCPKNFTDHCLSGYMPAHLVKAFQEAQDLLRKYHIQMREHS